jgi:phage-related protein
MIEKSPKPVTCVTASRPDFGEFSAPMKDRMGNVLSVAQQGGKHADAKRLKGIRRGRRVEIMHDHRGDKICTAYAVRFLGVVDMLHFPGKIEVGPRNAEGGQRADR